jgi:CheY-like chemotaxis protein
MSIRAESPEEKQARLFKQYVQHKKIMVVDSHSFSRAALASALIDLGASIHQIKLISQFNEAQAAINADCPDLLISEFDLNGGACGLDLMAARRKKGGANSKTALFILVTGNNSQAAVARAAEEDVDGYILKPYTVDGLRMAIMKHATEKIYPSEYVSKIQEGKRKLEENEIDQALTYFGEALKLDSKPSLAYFYHGLVEEMKKTLSNAELDYGRGLSFNRIHFKCLIALFELFMRQNRNKEAYDLAQRMARYFPANPDRLATVIKLAVLNEAFEDIERYYQLFCKLDHRNETLVRYVTAALIVCGKHYLQQKKFARAVELFARAKSTGLRNPKILKEIILSLLSSDLSSEAQVFLEAYPPALQGAPEYLAMRYACSEKGLPLGASIAAGRKLVADGIQEYILYATLIKRSIEGGFQDHADQLLRDAHRLWPEKEAELQKIRKNTTPRAA